MERVKVYRSCTCHEDIYIHCIDTPVYTTSKPGIYPRIEVRNDTVLGYTHNSRLATGAYPWVPLGTLVECFYDAEQGILL